MDSPLRIKFWGTRGLISSPRADTAIFGGNTTSMQILYKNHLILVDTGFGVSNLGEHLMERLLKEEKIHIHIFYTHFHWDHIQGLPFFHPVYFENSTLTMYSPIPVQIAKENLDLLFDGSYSPFEGIDSMPSTINFVELSNAMEIDGLQVDFVTIDHGSDPDNLIEQIGYAYKFESPEKETIVIATDHEARASSTNDNLVKFAENCDIFIHDGQYLEEEYGNRIGWGHSTIHQALENALKAKPKKMILTHHDPARSDNQLLDIYKELKESQRYKALSFEFAREEVEYAAESESPVKSRIKKTKSDPKAS